MQRLIRLLVHVLLWMSTPLAGAMPIGFDELADGTAVTDQYAGLGVRFGHAVVLTAGVSLNEFEFPPHSGDNVVYDAGGPMVLDFAQPLRAFGAFFTYSTRLHLAAYDASNQLVGLLASRFDSNLALAGDPGSTANEWIGFDDWSGVARLAITGDAAGGSFVVDDLRFAVGEPTTLALLLAAGLAFASVRARRHAAAPAAALLWCCAMPGLALAQTVGQPVLDPPTVQRHVASTVTVSAYVASEGRTVLASGVNLLRTDSAGGPARIVGALRDSGDLVRDGDLQAGDGIFSGRFVFDEDPGLVALRVSVPFAGTLLRLQSETRHLEVLDDLPDAVMPSNVQPANLVFAGGTERDAICNEVLLFALPGAPASELRSAEQSVQGKLVGLLAGSGMNVWQIRNRDAEPDLPESSEDTAVPDQCPSGEAWLGTALATLESAASPGGHLRGASVHRVARWSGVTPGDPLFPVAPAPVHGQWGLAKAQVDKAWAITRGAPSVIAVIDTGVDPAHPDLPRVTRGRNHTVKPRDARHGDPRDTNGHGTHVAGIAAAAADNGIGVAGACWNCSILAVKVLPGGWLAVAQGIRSAVSAGASILNLSLEGGADESVARAVHDMEKAGRLAVAAAGNGNTGTRQFPAGFTLPTTFPHRLGDQTYQIVNLISVGATDQTDARANPYPAPFAGGSNWGPWVSVYAPGSHIVSTWPAALAATCPAPAGAGYCVLSGTSMAAPLVAGIAALVARAQPGANAFWVRQKLVTTSSDTGAVEPGGAHVFRVDGFAAVFESFASLRNCARCPAAPEVTVTKTDVTMGAPRPYLGSQRQSSHGVWLPLEPPGPTGHYLIDFDAQLSTWDSYDPRVDFGTGYYDAFLIGVSAFPYYVLNLADPLDAHPASLSIGLLWGGVNWADGTLESRRIRQAVAVRSVGPVNLLGIGLDTSAPPDVGTTHPSWGTIRILDITPQ